MFFYLMFLVLNFIRVAIYCFVRFNSENILQGKSVEQSECFLYWCPIPAFWFYAVIATEGPITLILLCFMAEKKKSEPSQTEPKLSKIVIRDGDDDDDATSDSQKKSSSQYTSQSTSKSLLS